MRALLVLIALSPLHGCYSLQAAGGHMRLMAAREPIDVVVRTDAGTDANAFKADVWFLRAGEVLGWMRGLEGASSSQLNRLADKASA